MVSRIRVINDAAERGVKLFSDHNSSLSNDEDQKQYIIKIVADYRKKYSDCRKKNSNEVN